MSGLVVGTILKNSKACGNSRLVLIVIGDCARDDGTGAWPSIKTIANRAGISERTTQRAIRELAELGELQIGENEGPKGAHLYSVLMEGLEGDNLAWGVTRKTRGGVKSGKEGVTQVTPNPSFLSIEPSKEREEPPPPDSIKTEEIVAGWNDVLAPLGLPKVSELNADRKAKLRLRMMEHPDFDWWDTVFSNIKASDFLKGNNPRGWRCTLDFLINNNSNAVRIYEGEFRNKVSENGRLAANR